MNQRVRKQHLLTVPDAVGEAEEITGVRARDLAATLAENLEGEVRFDRGSRALYATDASNYRQPPIGVVIPRTLDDVVRTVAICRGFGAPILARGGGTSLAGECCNTAVVMDFTKHLGRVLEIDAENRRARVQPGTILDTLRDAAEEHGLTFAPDPATHTHCALGGMIGNNSCGIHSMLSEFYGPGPRTSDNLEELEVLTYDGLRLRVGRTNEEELARIIQEGGRRGEIYRRLRDLRDRYADQIRESFPDIPRRVSGYNLDELLPENGFHVARALAGTESTCVTFLEATLTLVDHPRARALLVLGYPSVYEAGDHVPALREHKPIGLEGMDDVLVGYVRRKGLHAEYLELLPEGNGWLLAEFGGESEEEAEENARAAMKALEREKNPPSMKLLTEAEDAEKMWTVRESGLGATAFVPGDPDTWPGWEDTAVHPDRIGDYLRDLRALLEKHDYECALYGHFGQGLIHTRIDFELTTSRGIERFREFTREAAELVVSYGGSISGEHGDGQARGDLLPIMFGDELVAAFREFKSIWDPEWKMNPGKVIDARPRTADLRLGADYSPWMPPTHFRYPEDDGSFAHATLRCVGVGKCRRGGGGTMCPSYMVTHEEMHTTRGRAHLLFEMLQGEVVTDGWRSEEVKESLDLCLACKGCKGDCPVNVDIATYKAEFLSHYYEGRLRPRSAYAFGLIPWWSRLAGAMPHVANLVTQTPGLSRLAKWAAGIAPERGIPAYAPRTFRDSWRSQRATRRRRPEEANGTRTRVILWPDTFNNYFHPATLQAGVEVLESAGCEVVIPEQWLCCGRPLYEFGMLTRARRQLRQIMGTLREEIRAGTALVGLEPSCVSVFRDELVGLFPHDQDAKRLADQTFTLGEFLMNELEEYQPPRLEHRAVLHGHCHEKSVLEYDATPELLQRMGLELEVLDSGCCGMAGSFGYEAGEKYEVSVACAERVLAPAVRAAPEDALIVADGFSCRGQIQETTERRALHLAEVLQMALRQRELPAELRRPERRIERLQVPALAGSTSALRGAAVLGGALLLGGAALRGLTQVLGNGKNGRHNEEKASERWTGKDLGRRLRQGRRRNGRAQALRTRN